MDANYTAIVPADEYLKVNGVNIHYLNYPGDKPKILLLHGLTANANAFGGLMRAGLGEHFHVIAPDLRGRGLSDQPAFSYSMSEHAGDIIALLDHLKIEQAILVGHSFGGLLSYYMAYKYKKRVKMVIALDAAAEMNPRAGEMLSFSLLRLDKVFPSYNDYLAIIKSAPYNTFWEESMESYYRADVKNLPNGAVTPRSNLVSIIEAIKGVANEPWTVYLNHIEQPVLLLNAVENYTLDEPLLPDFKARESVDRLVNGQYKVVAGNHQTMLYGPGARDIVAAIVAFTGAGKAD
ncbi:MAG: alpha/beta hydrolase [Chitinophagia bacterium]|nr:alpha/beta hydrolase [Chitinophagia bacterium]